MCQRRRDDTKNRIFAFGGGGLGGLGAERKIVQNAVFRGKRHNNKILKVQIMLSRNFVVIAQAPSMVLHGLGVQNIAQANAKAASSKVDREGGSEDHLWNRR